MYLRNLQYLLLAAGLLACSSPQLQLVSDTTQTPELTPGFAVMGDGYRLPLMMWQAHGEPQAVVLALHGFNDYSNAFSDPADRFAAHNIMTYAYDQRGFGDTSQRGVWPGNGKLQADARTLVQLLCEQHPGLPLFLIGESMGGAVVMTLSPEHACVKGLILVAPAVWGWQTMPFWQQLALRIAVHIAPGKTLTGKGLDITPSDNTAMLRRLGQDPKIIKQTRIDSIFGLTNLMETALLANATLTRPTLILYGEKDEIIPAIPTCKMLEMQSVQKMPPVRLALYPDGYHMLTRDLQAEVVIEDMLAWMDNPGGILPSGHGVTITSPRVTTFCEAKQ